MGPKQPGQVRAGRRDTSKSAQARGDDATERASLHTDEREQSDEVLSDQGKYEQAEERTELFSLHGISLIMYSGVHPTVPIQT